MVDGIKLDSIRMMNDLKMEKSESGDVSILVSTGRLIPSILERGNHARSDMSCLITIGDFD